MNVYKVPRICGLDQKRVSILEAVSEFWTEGSTNKVGLSILCGNLVETVMAPELHREAAHL